MLKMSLLLVWGAVLCLVTVGAVADTTTQRQCSYHMQECDITLQEKANQEGGPGPCCSRFERCSGETFNGPLHHRCFPILPGRR